MFQDDKPDFPASCSAREKINQSIVMVKGEAGQRSVKNQRYVILVTPIRIQIFNTKLGTGFFSMGSDSSENPLGGGMENKTETADCRTITTVLM